MLQRSATKRVRMTRLCLAGRAILILMVGGMQATLAALKRCVYLNSFKAWCRTPYAKTDISLGFVLGISWLLNSWVEKLPMTIVSKNSARTRCSSFLMEILTHFLERSPKYSMRSIGTRIV